MLFLNNWKLKVDIICKLGKFSAFQQVEFKLCMKAPEWLQQVYLNCKIN